MVQGLLVGLVAGVAAALLFVSPFGGTPLAIPLFALTGLPIAIAGLGWGNLATLVAAVAGAAGAFAMAQWVGALAFVLLFAVPVGWATAMATQPRPLPTGKGWWPAGFVLANAAAAVAVGVILIGVVVGFDPPALTQEITQAMAEWAATVNPGPGDPPTAADLEPLVRLNVTLLPATIGIIGVGMVALDLYLAEKSVRFSDLLRRPEEAMSTIAVPALVPAALVVAVVLAFVPGTVGHAAEAVAGALGAAVALVGLAVLHALTRGMAGRIAVLAVSYALILLSGLPLVLFALLGIAENMFHLRARRLRPRGPTPTS